MDDYSSAAMRHFMDAQRLKEEGRLDNAGHLIGFSAECAIKHKIDSLRPNVGAPHGHLPDLLAIARRHLVGRRNCSMFALLRMESFSTWNVNRRYHTAGTTSDAEIQEWFQMASRLMAAAGVKR